MSYKRFGKRCLDLSLVVLSAFVLFPLFSILYLIVWWRLGVPVFFRQERPGMSEKSFLMYKFRSMTDARGEDGELLPNAQRITPLGRFLRGSSLDELPELFNILKGDMSLVGPRPLRMEYLDYYSDRERRRHEVRPGLTGWAQVNGRNAQTWNMRFDYDVWYVDNVGFWLDLKILAITVWKVIRREGITTEENGTMPPLNEVREREMGERNGEEKI